MPEKQTELFALLRGIAPRDGGPCLGVERSAGISTCRQYRYWLKRQCVYGGDGRTVCFVMLNPSTADGETDDPTIRRCWNYTQRWGFSSMVVRNLFAYRATDPHQLLTAIDPVGPHGDVALWLASRADLIVCAWGSERAVWPR